MSGLSERDLQWWVHGLIGVATLATSISETSPQKLFVNNRDTGRMTVCTWSRTRTSNCSCTYHSIKVRVQTSQTASGLKTTSTAYRAFPTIKVMLWENIFLCTQDRILAMSDMIAVAPAAVKLHSWAIKSVGRKGHAPRKVKLFINRPSLGFSEATDFPAVQEFDLSEADLEGKPLSLK